MKRELERLTELIEQSGLSRRQFARCVMGRDESTVQNWYGGHRKMGGPAKAWIRAVMFVSVNGGRVYVTLRHFAPTRRPYKRRGQTP